MSASERPAFGQKPGDCAFCGKSCASLEPWTCHFCGVEFPALTITNLGSGTSTRGNYIARVMRRGTERTVQREARIEGHPRLSAPVWHLVQRALDGAFGQRRASR